MKTTSFMEKLLDGVDVEWRALGEVATVTIGEFVHKNNQDPAAMYPVYNGGTSHTGFYDQYNNTGNKVIVSARGANAGFVNRITKPYWAGNSCYSIGIKNEEELNWSYIYYYLKNSENSLIGEQQKGGIPAISKKQMETVLVPIPCPDNPEKSLDIQAEIVRILDAFSAYTAELTAELTARKKQYHYYRDLLLSFDEGKVEWKTLGDICDFTYGYAAKAQDVGDARFVRITDINSNGKLIATDPKYVEISDESERYLLKKNDLLMARTGATYGKTMIFEEDYPAIYAGFLIKLNIDKTIIDPKFYWHFAQSDFFWSQANKLVSGGGQPQFNANALKEIRVPIPYFDNPEKSLAEQARIVAILDKFDALTTSLTEGLPREIALRQQQYEYYRDLLLSFPKSEQNLAAESAE